MDNDSVNLGLNPNSPANQLALRQTSLQFLEVGPGSSEEKIALDAVIYNYVRHPAHSRQW